MKITRMASRLSLRNKPRLSSFKPKDALFGSTQIAVASPNFNPHHSSDLFSYIIDHIGDEILIIRNDGRIVFANKAVIQNLGYPKKDLLNSSITDLYAEKIEIQKWQKTNFHRVKTAKKPVSYVVARRTAGGDIQKVAVTSVYLALHGEEYMLAAGRDVTEELALQEKTKESEKMRAIQRFIVGATQEMRDPLKGVYERSRRLIDAYKTKEFEYIGFKEFQD